MRTTGRLWGAPLLCTAALAATLASAAPAAGQATTAHIRLAHFSPDTPEMDVYVAAFDGTEQRVLEGLGYGEVSDYAGLEAGNYSFLLRPMGASPTSTPAVTASADLAAGAAYTFAAMGPNAALQKALLTDDLTAPPAGQATVRLIQASSSAGEVDLAVVDGPSLAENRPFASATGYAPLASGTSTVRVTTGDGTVLRRRLDLTAGTVNTLVVLEGTGAGPELTQVVDATGTDVSSSGQLGATQAVPLGGVGTGGGGMADLTVGDGSPTARTLGMVASAVLTLAAGVVVIVRMRRPRLEGLASHRSL